jgi:hypothetical protein
MKTTLRDFLKSQLDELTRRGLYPLSRHLRSFVNGSRYIDMRPVVAVLKLLYGMSDQEAIQVLRPAVAKVMVSLDSEVEIPDTLEAPLHKPKKRIRRKRIAIEPIHEPTDGPMPHQQTLLSSDMSSVT